MPPQSLRKLVSLQNSYLGEIQLIQTRFVGKAPDTLNKAIIQSRLDSVEAIWTEVRKIHSDIIAREDSGNDPYIQDNVFSILQSKYEDVTDLLLTARTQFEVADETAIRPPAIAAPVLSAGEPMAPPAPPRASPYILRQI